MVSRWRMGHLYHVNWPNGNANPCRECGRLVRQSEGIYVAEPERKEGLYCPECYMGTTTDISLPNESGRACTGLYCVYCFTKTDAITRCG